MAELQVEGDELVVHMTTLEKAEGFHGDIRVPLSSVRAVHGTGPAVVVELVGAEYHRFVGTADDVGAVAGRLRAATGGD